MSIRPAHLRFGVTCILSCCVACRLHVAPDEPNDQTPQIAAAAEESPDDFLLPAGIVEPLQAPEPVVIEVTAAAPFCCDSLERIFEAKFGAEAVLPLANCHWDFDDGRFADGCRVRHRFNWAGEYVPSVTVVMPDGTTLVDSIELAVGYEGSDTIDATPDVEPDEPDEPTLDDGDMVTVQTGPVQLEYFAGPFGDTAPGRHEVAWRFLDIAPPTGVQLHRGCCECPSADSQILAPDADGIYTTMVDIPQDRSAWYFVRYTLAGVEHIDTAVHTNPVPSQASTVPQSTVIWCFVGSRDEPESLATALRSNLITHVAIFAGNRETSDTLDAPQTQEAIAIAQHEGVELILIRYLWATQPGPAAELTTLLDVAYYVREIELLRQEADRIGAASVGFDTETYGSTPLADHFRAADGFLREDYEALVSTLDVVLGEIGQVDFILPAGSVRENHPYGALSALGRKRISESTYYDNEQDIDWIPYSYDLAGMYVNVTKDHPARPLKPYFLPREVFGEKAHIWRRTQGLMIWPREERAGEVAEMLTNFAGECSANPDFQ